MATPAEQVEVSGRSVRVTSPDRVIYQPTERTPAISKLEVCAYFASVGEVLMRAIGDRPTAMERWPGGYAEGMRLSTGYGDDGDGCTRVFRTALDRQQPPAVHPLHQRVTTIGLNDQEV